MLAFLDKVMAIPRPPGPDGGLGKNVTFLETVVALEPRIAEYFKDQPAAEATVRNALGNTYRNLGEAKSAIQQHERALVLRQAALVPDHHDTIVSRNNLALAYKDDGQPALGLSRCSSRR